MKAILQQPYEQLSGKNGALVNYSLSGNPIVRAFVTPANPQTTVQQTLRGYFTSGSQAFNDLTDSERAAWKTVADAIQRTNSLGQQYTISEKGLYVMVNQYRQMDGQAITDTAPSITQGGAPSSLVSLKTDSGDLRITLGHSMTGGFWLIEVSDALPGLQRQARDNEIYMVSTTIADNIVAVDTSPQTITIGSADLKYAVSVGQRKAVRITRITSGYIKGASLTVHDTVVAV